MATKIDVFMVVGFLGAGKTSLLQNLLSLDWEGPSAVLVNDFGKIPVDAALIEQGNQGLQLYEVSNGSIFCTCKSDDFVRGLNLLGRGKPQRIFVEASGMADPSSFSRLLSEYQIEQKFRVRSVLTVVDPEVFLKIHTRLPALDRQISSADLLYLNKTDISSPEMIDQVKDILVGLNPTATLRLTHHGRLTGEDQTLLLQSVEKSRQDNLETCNTPTSRPGSMALVPPRTLGKEDLELLSRWYTNNPILRMKGWLRVDGITTYISDNGRQMVSAPRALAPGVDEGLVVICTPEELERVSASWRQLWNKES